MDVTGESLFLRTKVHPSKRTCPNTVVSVLSGKSPIADDSSGTSMVANEEYHKQINPTLNLLRLLGLLPIEMSSDGMPTFRILSPIMAYSLFIYFIKIFTAYKVFCTTVLPRFFRSDDFATTLFAWMFLISLVLYVSLPILMCLDSSILVLHMNKWLQFQALFREVTRRQLVLGVRSRCLIASIISILVGIAFAGATHFMPSTDLWSIPLSFFMGTLMVAFEIYRVVSYSALTIAGQTLVLSLKSDLQQGKLSAYLIGEYRVLWLQLSKLTSDVGNVMGKATLFFLSVYVFSLTSCLYGCLAGILSKTHSVVELAGQGLGFTISVLTLYWMCSRAHEVTETVGTETQEELQLIRTHCLHPEIKEQVREFLQTIAMNPPVISALGFVVINKGMAKSYASALVTYMIVLLQFNLGQPNKRCDCNMTQDSDGPSFFY